MRVGPLVLMLLAGACGSPRPATDPPAAPAAPSVQTEGRDPSERENLLNIGYGASVVFRTAELTLEQSALRAIDGDPITTWTSPPDDGTDQTIVFALPARTRVEQIGIQTPAAPPFHLKSAQLDSSVDGVNFAPLSRLETKDVEEVQLFPVTPPREVVYLRFTTLEAPGRFARVNSVQIRGKWTEAPKQAPLEGCWTINGVPARFTVDRGRVIGTIAGNSPVSLDGGSDGVIYRFVWVSGPNRGFGAISMPPDGNRLSGLRWYEEPGEYMAAESWFGERTPCGREAPAEDVPSRFLALKRRLPLYGLRFDDRGALVEAASEGALDVLAHVARQPASQRLRLVSREYRLASKEQNQQISITRLESLRSALRKRGIESGRFDWAPLGNDTAPARIETEIQRSLYAGIELEAQ